MTEQLFDVLGDDSRLAAITRLLSAPPHMRRGWTELVKPANPAATAGFTRKIPSDAWERMLSFAFGFVASSAAGVRTLAFNLLDADGFVINQTPINSQIGPSASFTAYGDIFSVTQTQPSGGFANSNTATNPTAATLIASVAVPAGTYTVNWQVELAGTVAAGDANNMQLNSVGTRQLLGLFPGVAGTYPQPSCQVSVPAGGGTISISATANASGVSAVYFASLAVSPLPGFGNQVQIPDLVMKSSWQYQIVLGNPQAGDQISNIGLLLERYPSSLAAGLVL